MVSKKGNHTKLMYEHFARDDSLVVHNAPVTRAYICQRMPTYGDTSDKLGARII